MSQDRDALLRLVRGADEPSSYDEERVLSALQRAVAAGQVSPVSERVEASMRSSGAVSVSTALPGLTLAGLAVLSLGAVGLLLHRRAPEPTQPAAIHAPLASSQPSARVLEGERAPALDGSVQQDPLRPTQPSTDAAAAGVRPRPRAGARRAAHSAGQAPATTTDKAPPNELVVLQRVQAALRRRDGAAALAELNAHAPHDGLLVAELDAARILALCLLERTEEARAAAARFAIEHPTSPQQAVIGGSCANPTRNGAP